MSSATVLALVLLLAAQAALLFLDTRDQATGRPLARRRLLRYLPLLPVAYLGWQFFQ